MFIHSNIPFHYAQHFRVIEIGGRFGSGKTLTTFQMAFELITAGKFRYLLSNLNSVWTDSPKDVVLRDGQFVDAVVILDEGGLFLKYSDQAEKFMAGLRKLNVCILVPTVVPPSSRIQFVTITRALSLGFVGIPYWHYNLKLNLRGNHENEWFGIYKPSEMFGIYDTLDIPTDDAYLSLWLDYWIENIKAKNPNWRNWGPPPGYDEEGKIGRKTKRETRSRESAQMAELGRELENVIGQTSDLVQSLPVYANKRTNKKSW